MSAPKRTPDLEAKVIAAQVDANGVRRGSRAIAAELQSQGIEISFATVARILKAEREERTEARKDVLRDKLEGSLTSDLDVVEEVLQGNLEVWRAGKPLLVKNEAGEIVPFIPMAVRDWTGVSKQITSLVALRMELLGVSGKDQPAAGGGPEDLTDDELDERLAHLGTVADARRSH